MSINQKLRVALVIQDMYQLGAQYVTALVAKGLSQRGHQIEVVVSAVHDRIGRERPDLSPFPLPEAVRLAHLPYPKASQNVLALAGHLWRTRPDVVMPMSSNYEPACALAMCLWPRACRPRLMPVEHSGGIGMTQSQSKVEYTESHIRRFFSRLATAQADHVVAVSRGVADALVETGKYPRDKVTIIYNPVVDDKFFEKKAVPASHPWLAEKTVPVIVAAGAHVPLKGYDVLVCAFSQVVRKIDCRLVLFGEGPLTPMLRALAKEQGVADRVSLPGHTDNLPANLKNADVFVVSSHCESFSVVLVEALACGVPVVATDCPSGPSEILKGGEYGVLVDPNNPQALADGIMRVLSGDGIQPPPESWQPYALSRISECYETTLLCVLGETGQSRPACVDTNTTG